MTLTEMYEALPKPDCDMKPGDEICHVANDMIELAMKGDDNQDGILNIDVEAISVFAELEGALDSVWSFEREEMDFVVNGNVLKTWGWVNESTGMEDVWRIHFNAPEAKVDMGDCEKKYLSRREVLEKLERGIGLAVNSYTANKNKIAHINVDNKSDFAEIECLLDLYRSSSRNGEMDSVVNGNVLETWGWIIEKEEGKEMWRIHFNAPNEEEEEG